MLVSIYHDLFNDTFVEICSVNRIDQDNAVKAYESMNNCVLIHESTVSDTVDNWSGSILIPSTPTENTENHYAKLAKDLN